MKYVVGRSNLSVTVFVPWDCEKHCPFCTSKEFYSSMECSLPKVLMSLEYLCSTGIREVVVSGGEPFSNLDGLEQILQNVGVPSITPRCNDSQSTEKKVGKKRSRTSKVRPRATGQLQARRL